MWDFTLPNGTKIEIQGSQYHNYRPYDPTNQEYVTEAEHLQKSGEIHKQDLQRYRQWTICDPAKRDIAKRYGLTVVELWNETDVKNFIGDDLYSGKIVYFTDSCLKHEYDVFKNFPGVYDYPVVKDYLIRFFQQTSKLTDDFNTFTFKKICEDYNLKSCYDPCGKLGRKMLGASNLEHYIYNEQDNESFDNVLAMGKYLKIIKNKKSSITVYNNDPVQFVPSEYFDSIIVDTNDSKIIDKMFELYYNTNNCKFIGISTDNELTGYSNKITSLGKVVYIYTK